MDKHLGKDSLTDAFDKFNEFERYSRTTESVNAFISEFDNCYQKLVKLGIKLPPEILAFKLLNQVNISQEEQMLVKSGIDYTEKDKMYEQTQSSLKKFKGDGTSGSASAMSHPAIKVEPVFQTSTRGNYQSNRRTWNRGRGVTYGGARGGMGGFSRNSRDTDTTHRGRGKGARPVNPSGPDGRPLRCSSCGSYRHLIKHCPDSWENKTYLTEDQVEDVFQAEDTEDWCLYTGHNPSEMHVFTSEAMNCAVLDSACSSTVCGRRWMDSYMNSLDEDQKQKIARSDSARIFKFGGGTRLISEGQYEIPATLAGHKVKIRTDVVDSDIPLLLSKAAMKKAQMKLDLVHDTAEIMGEQVTLNCTSSGHYCVPIIQDDLTYAVDLAKVSDKEREQILTKLHWQFGHSSSTKIINLLKDAQIWDTKYRDMLKRIVQECNICRKFSKTPSRSKVALPMAHSFNDIVCIDLKSWKNGYILHIIDMWSCYSVSVFVRSKQPKEIIDKIMGRWISIFGIMNGLMSDNGGEFSCDEVREVASILNVRVHTTAGYSPHQNGLCERVHGVIDIILHKLHEQCSNVDLNVLLGWANMAKNSLHSHHGFSSHQLVFGRNPNLPNILTANPPSLEGRTMSEIFANHLNALHAAREAFIKSEASERLRRALRHKITVIEQFYNRGDIVFYKKDTSTRWLGPAQVIGQDGKIIFLRHGGVILRVPPNRVIGDLQPEIPAQQLMASDTKSDTEATNAQHPHYHAPRLVISDESEDETEHPSTEHPSNPITSSENESSGFHKDTGAASSPSSHANDVHDGDDVEQDNGSDLEHDYTGDQEHDSESRLRPEHSEQSSNETLGQENFPLWRSLRLLNKEHDWEVFSVQVPKSQHSDPKCIVAKQEELQKLKDFDVYEEVEFCGQPCISTRWVVTRKGEAFRARLVARGFQEEEEVRTDSPTIGKSVTSLCLAVAASQGWTLKSTDIKSAFLQSDSLDRDVFLAPPKEVEKPGKVWKLRKGLYGLNDTARQFHLSLAAELARLGCKQSKLDHTLYYKSVGDETLQGIILTHVDDFLHCGDAEFHQEVIQPLTQRFKAGREAEAEFKYVGIQISQNEHFEISVNQNQYTQSMEIPEVANNKHADLSPTEYSEFRSLVGGINWAVCGTRPDLAYDVVEHSSKFKHATQADMFMCAKSVKRCKQQVVNIFPSLGHFQKWKLILYSDASYANLPDKTSSTLGYIIWLVGDNNRCCPLSWRANKIKRICRSTLTAETMALVEGLEECLYLRALLYELQIFNSENGISCYVDNMSLRDAVYSTKLVDDKRLRIDIASIKEMMENGDIQQICWCPADQQLANGLTKRGASVKELLDVIQSGRIHLY